ncbi:MAG: bleomycin resistance protein [Cypionkella sp.]
MSPSLVPELEVSDAATSLAFYTGLLGFTVDYHRADEGFAYLRLGTAELMLDQSALSRSFTTAPLTHPFGRGVNLQIIVEDVTPLLVRLAAAGHPLHLPLEDRWYTRHDHQVGNRQFIVADPDGYLLRFTQDLGTRTLP